MHDIQPHLPRKRITFDPPDLILEVTDTKLSNCYHEVHYRLRSAAYLSDTDIDMLRKAGLFMSGQETGTLIQGPRAPLDYLFEYEVYDEGESRVRYWRPIYEYKFRSICDSSD